MIEDMTVRGFSEQTRSHYGIIAATGRHTTAQ
jgi:hypothetical protein